MKNHLLKKVAIFSVISLLSCATFSQESDQKTKLKQANKNRQLSFVTFKENSNYPVDSFEKILKAEFQLQDGIEFVKQNTETDQLGFTHDEYHLYINNIKVEFATFIVHSKNDKIFAINGESYKTNNVSTSPEISAQNALQNAIKHLNAKKYLWDNPAEAEKLDNYKKPSGELVLLPIFNDESVDRCIQLKTSL